MATPTMKTLYYQAKRRLKDGIKDFFRKALYLNYEFLPARSIQKQAITFKFRDQTQTLEADYTAPLYDTIAEVVDYDCYQLGEVRFSGSSDSLVLDIGAHIGTATVVLARAHAGRVISFEPLPRNLQWLENNIKLNGLANVQVVPAAFAEQDGTITFHVNPDFSVAGHAAHTVNSDPLAFRDAIQVRAITLPTALAPYGNVPIELIKLDCEGGEYAVVDQITPELARRIRCLTLEVHDLDGARNVKTLRAKLEALGYRVVYKKELHQRRGLHHLLACRD
jgi:FkbM family methyltransferase